MSDDEALERAIERMAKAAQGFVNGDPGGFTALWSHREDVTIFGGYGSGERGREEIVARLAWASSRFRGGELDYEPITSGSSGDLGYAIGIERGRATVEGCDEPGELCLRVTHLFRREEGEWKLMHRHADAVVSVISPDALLQQPSAGAC